MIIKKNINNKNKLIINIFNFKYISNMQLLIISYNLLNIGNFLLFKKRKIL